ncbi:MAG TPA: inositol monophosphatase family protein, partial [Pseudohaliea sp.]|nr:inositol monophosphatase family protein [Pseudohaliea sp.]
VSTAGGRRTPAASGSAAGAGGAPAAVEGIVVLASRRHRNDRLERAIAYLEAEAGPVQRLNSGSALKFVQLAAGQGDVYPRFSPCSEWDVAAGQALLEGAGGAVLGLDGEPLRYNARASLLSPHFLAVADPARPLWRRLLAQL